MKVYTEGYGGQDISKTILVDTNDPDTPVTSIRVSGKVERFADIQPYRVQLTGPAGSAVSTEVVVTPLSEYPFRILDVRLQRGQDARIALSERPGPNGQARYVVRLDNLRSVPGRYYDNLLIRTDSRVKPEIRLSVYGQIFPARETAPEKEPDAPAPAAGKPS